MPSKNPVQRLTEIIENIAIIAEFTAGMVFEDYVNDRKTVYAVTRALEIISEASRRLPTSSRSATVRLIGRGLRLRATSIGMSMRSLMMYSCGLRFSMNWGRSARLLPTS